MSATVRRIERGRSSTSAEIYLTDTATLASIQQGIPGATPLPDSLRAALPDDAPAPVLLSQGALASLGGTDGVTVNGRPVDVVAVSSRGIGFGEGSDWMLLDRRHVAGLGLAEGTASEDERRWLAGYARAEARAREMVAAGEARRAQKGAA